MDFLRTTYKSKFYYGSRPDNFVVGRFAYAADDAQVLLQSEFYRSGVWLDSWELHAGIGDSLEGYQRVAGVPVSQNVFKTLKTVNPLRTGCTQFAGEAMPVSTDVYGGMPRKCWSSVPDFTGPHSYLVTVVVFQVTNGARLFTLDFSGVVSWNDLGFWEYRIGIQAVVRIVPRGGYPGGEGLEITAYEVVGPVATTIATWVLSLGSQQASTDPLPLPNVPVGWTIISPGTASNNFVDVDKDWSVNPADDFP